MPTVGDLDAATTRQALHDGGLRIVTGPFNCSLRTDVAEIAADLTRLYAHHPLVPPGDMVDLHVEAMSGRGLRRWFRPQAHFQVDGVSPFTPLPRAQALPMLEWGLNWCITAYFHHLLVLHAACLARDDQALILPAPPGSGKSTLCAALAQRGWRLLSDELTLVDLRDLRVWGLARPVSLKNASIDVIRRFDPQAWMTTPVHDTAKGTVALMAPSPASVAAMHRPANARWLVLPRYVPQAPAVLTPMQPSEAFMQIADNAMNYHILGRQGFDTVGALTDACAHHRFSYSRLDDAIRVFDDLARNA
ncbi:HprK-related kinase A [Roseateles sp. P5_E7]